MAGKTLAWSARAKRDLKKILSYYRQRNGNDDYSIFLTAKFRNATKRIEENELIGQRFGETIYRFVVIQGRFQLFYRLGNKRHNVVAVWDARRDPDVLDLSEK